MLLNGETVNHGEPYERNVSTVFQSYALFPHLTARQNVVVFAETGCNGSAQLLPPSRLRSLKNVK